MRHLLLAAVLLGSSTEPAPVPEALAISVSVQPRHDGRFQLLPRTTPDTYVCEVQVSGATSRTVGSTRLVVTTGKPEMITANYEDYSLFFSVKIDPQPGANRAETTVVVRRDYNIVAQQHSTIALLPTTPRYMPAAQ